MRMKNLFIWDVKFQARYGFYLLYTFLTILYAAFILALPISWKERAAAILIYSDPAAMGLFFMGAIVLLEKSQRVTAFMSITPVSAREYVASKVFSLCAISVVVAVIMAAASGSRSVISVAMGTLLASTVYTLCGIIVATKIVSLNQFILATVPVEIVGFVPAVLGLFLDLHPGFRLYPPVACMELVAGKEPSAVGMLLTILTIILLFWTACRLVRKMWQEQGGVKL
ncbi:fluoroquinolone export ABC transporter permease subunit [Butyrivibrio sp. MC2021]|uniref:fluoroquinolone export ABC transporter permease subunit n=1 Tax=Butyrivibrio sp. MC2021 TaxID=1408306 RepID=UPI000478F7DB|nr:hypothetical protein [Butyrivibrio sp. MC2021]